MSPLAVAVVWALIQIVQLFTWFIAYLRALRAAPMVRLPILLGAVPAMYGALVFGLFVETWVTGAPAPWSPQPDAWQRAWHPWWTLLALLAPVVVAMGLYGLWLLRRPGWAMAAGLAGLASAASGLAALAALPAR